MGRMEGDGGGERLWRKARSVVSALGAFKRSHKKVDLSDGDAGRTLTPMMPLSNMTPPRKASKKGCIALSACMVFIVLVVVTGTVIGVTVSKQFKSRDEVDNANSVSSICRRTLYPEVCNSTLAGTDTSSPQMYIEATMKAAMVAISKSLQAVEDLQLSSPKKTGIQYSTLKMCKDVLADSLEQVNSSLSRFVELKHYSSLKSEVGNIQQYMAAALTYQDTCMTGVQDFGVWDGSDQLNGTQATHVAQLLSNGLSLVNSLSRLTDFSKLFPSKSRRLLAQPSPPGSSSDFTHALIEMEDDISLGPEFPRWLSREGRRLLQEKPTPNAVVAQDGTGQYQSIQAAVNAAPSGGTRWVIYVKKAVYNEYISIPKDKKNLMMYGDGPGQTVITGSRSVKGSGLSTMYTATFEIRAPGTILRDLTIQNTAGPVGEQAVALRAAGDQQAYANVFLEGYQDTLYAHTLRQFYSQCSIYGTIDFIFGNAAAVFQSCNLFARPGMASSQNIYTASGRTDPSENTGFSFLSCTVGAAPGLADSFPTYLGRPWKAYSRTLFIKSSLAACVNPEGWLLWNNDPNSGNSVTYAEYQNSGPGADTARRVSWSKQISIAEASKFTVSSFIAGQEWLPATSITYSATL
ncbi:pectinesterase 2 [Physcomitrium patens]|uniref:Pectinesterase n=1 Tax=Physcomitrium patens TaxID=3218 RepID=A0A2K1J2X1_PHYPA|nr:pectinesterase 2-like [Physcomitrium patens]XP_024400054.1 pectinesterase 2-like [Physcomitrium patens]PNR35877.1 hypothetical protein PHYPA_021727 [Physcomitrium patens]|eukprot:XP_024400053.1 pectinesterase 2-like [Physcomitrella patens]